MADKDNEQQTDPRSNYANKIKEKIKEIDQKINTTITIPQYSKHTKQKTAVVPYYYYRENKEHYMSVFEHLTKKYDVSPYIYRELEMNEGYRPGCRHTFPYSGGCAQCSHYPIYANPRDPFKPNPPILNIKSNQNHLRRWIEFTELDDNLVLMEELKDEWNAYQNRYEPIVSHQQVMHKFDARKLYYLMQQEDFVYDDFVGRTPNYISSNFTYDKPIIENVDNSFARMLQKKKGIQDQKSQEQDENEEQKKTQADKEKQQQNQQKENFQTVQQLQESLQKQTLANQQLQDEIAFLKSQGNKLQDQGKNQVGFQDDVSFSNKPLNNKNVQGQNAGSDAQMSITSIERSQTKIRQPPSQTNIQKMYNNNFAVRPSTQEFNLKTFDNKSQYSQEVLQSGQSNKNIILKTANQLYQDQNAQQIFRQPYEEEKKQISNQKIQRTTFTHFVSSQSQLGGQQKKLLPSSVIKLKTRNQLPNNEDYYGYNVTPTHVQEEQNYELQINSLQNFDEAEERSHQQLDVKEDREKFIQQYNQKVSSTAQLPRQLDSRDNSQSSIGQDKRQNSHNKFSESKVAVKLYEQTIQDTYEENTPMNEMY